MGNMIVIYDVYIFVVTLVTNVIVSDNVFSRKLIVGRGFMGFYWGGGG